MRESRTPGSARGDRGNPVSYRVKKVENHQHMVRLYSIRYNFVRLHKI